MKFINEEKNVPARWKDATYSAIMRKPDSAQWYVLDLFSAVTFVQNKNKLRIRTPTEREKKKKTWFMHHAVACNKFV